MQIGFLLLALGLLIGGNGKINKDNGWTYAWLFFKIALFFFFAAWIFPYLWPKIILYAISGFAIFVTLICLISELLPRPKDD